MVDCYDLAWSSNEFFENGTIERDLVEKVRKWAENESIVPRSLTQSQIVAFLIANDCQFEATCERILDYFTIRKNVPELFSNRDCTLPQIAKQLDALSFATAPNNTKEGYAVCFSRLKNSSASAYDMEMALKIYLMQIDAVLHLRPAKGICFVYDLTNMTVGHTMRVRIGILKKTMKYVEKCMPTKMISIHIINATAILDLSMELIKKVMSGKTIQMMHIYRTNCDLSEFFDKHIPRELVPSDYGGHLPPLEEMHADFRKSLEDLIPAFIAEEKQRDDI